MKKIVLYVCVIGLLNTASAGACDLIDKRKIRVGVSEGIAGKCSNNTLPIQCVSDGKEATRLTCNGPEGSYSGSDLQDLISTACGCSANSDNGRREQLRNELGES